MHPAFIVGFVRRIGRCDKGDQRLHTAVFRNLQAASGQFLLPNRAKQMLEQCVLEDKSLMMITGF